MASKNKNNNWYNNMGKPEDSKEEVMKVEKESAAAKKASKESSVAHMVEEMKMTVKVTFEGEAAQRILKCESQLKERLTKPDMGKILGAEILTWSEQRWSEIVEENTDIDFFFAQIRKCSDKSKSLKLLKALSEKLEGDDLPAPGMASQTESLDRSEASLA